MTTLKTTATSTGDSEQKLGEILAHVTALREQLSQLIDRESELRAVLERETELEPQLVRLGKILRKHVLAEQPAAAIANATLHLDPCPYIVVDNFLPDMF